MLVLVPPPHVGIPNTLTSSFHLIHTAPPVGVCHLMFQRCSHPNDALQHNPKVCASYFCSPVKFLSSLLTNWKQVPVIHRCSHSRLLTRLRQSPQITFLVALSFLLLQNQLNFQHIIIANSACVQSKNQLHISL